VKSEADKKTIKVFVERLLQWNKMSNGRQMPWKGEKDPYKIWLSEIILQQTRVEQGLKYYENFISAFPDVHTLSDSPQDRVFKLWEGLGYYSRCRNLIETACYISGELKGAFPNDYDSILKLKGIGHYTAAAIASFAYNLPHAVVDGNVFRVLSRIFDIETPIDSSEGKKKFTALAQSILPVSRAGEYNQAIMDFGAVICKPVPECEVCFCNTHCKAYLSAKQQLLPVKAKKIKITQRWLNYVVIFYKNEVAIRQRTGKDIWQQLFEFIPIESDKKISEKQILRLFEKQWSITEYKKLASFEEITQKLTHQSICFNFTSIELHKRMSTEHLLWVPVSQLNQFAFPKTLKTFIDSCLLR